MIVCGTSLIIQAFVVNKGEDQVGITFGPDSKIQLEQKATAFSIWMSTEITGVTVWRPFMNKSCHIDRLNPWSGMTLPRTFTCLYPKTKAHARGFSYQRHFLPTGAPDRAIDAEYKIDVPKVIILSKWRNFVKLRLFCGWFYTQLDNGNSCTMDIAFGAP